MQSDFKITRRTLVSSIAKTGIVSALGPVRMVASARSSDALASTELVNELPRQARPWVYWFWFYGNVSREGITADLEAMHEIGIGGVMLLNVAKGDPGPVHFLSTEWLALIQHTIQEADRLGLDVDLNNCDGWSDAGGPWVKPELAMQKLVWTETHVDSGTHYSGVVPEPKAVRGYYRDLRVFAVPTNIAPVKPREPKVSFVGGEPSYVVHEYAEPMMARGADVNIYLGRPAGSSPVTWQLEASDDGNTWRTVYEFDNRWRFTLQHIPRVLPTTIHFAPLPARFFRLVVPFVTEEERGEKGRGQHLEFSLLAEARVSLWQAKAGYINNIATSLLPPNRYADGWVNAYSEKTPATDDSVRESIVPRDRIIDLTARVHDGHLDWDVPAGQWTLIRLGHTPTGSLNHTGSPDGIGLNVDMMSAAAFDAHFPHVLGKVSAGAGASLGKTLMAFHNDSWEAGILNWTPSFAEEFAKRRGYSMEPYFAVLAGGRIVESLEVSDRFLWDFRRTIADLIAENFWGRQAELAHKHGVRFSGEGAGRQQFLIDPLLYLSKADFPMGEFWFGEGEVRPDCDACSSVGHAFAKPMVLAEAYTSASYGGYRQAGQWRDHPYSLKAYGDRAFSHGISKYVFHRSLSQPSLTDRPGLAWGDSATADGIGINMERTQTWWKSCAAWISYLTRCQHLLQSGHAVVDVCALTSEDVPNFIMRPADLEDGYKYDGIHAEVLALAKVQNGDLVLPSGMRYRVLVLPQSERMTLRTARTVARLIDGGAMVVGPRPRMSPSLGDRDSELEKIAIAYWDAGRVLSSVTIALERRKLVPDFTWEADEPKPEILFLHRVVNGAEVYFLSNQSSATVQIKASFRVSGRTPEFLDPDSGVVRKAAVFDSDGQCTTIPLTLDPSGSFFVLFQERTERRLKRILKDGVGFSVSANAFVDGVNGVECFANDRGVSVTANVSGAFELEDTRGRSVACAMPEVQKVAVNGSWQVSFPPGLGAPAEIEMKRLISWSDAEVSGVRFFSGSAVYETEFDVPAEMLRASQVAYLDLGDVQIIAEVRLNDIPLGTRWKPPFVCVAGSALRPGKNKLAITVTNLWPNRLIGDSALPAEQRITRTNFNPYRPDSPLLPSGLLGPVQLTFGHQRTIAWSEFL